MTGTGPGTARPGAAGSSASGLLLAVLLFCPTAAASDREPGAGTGSDRVLATVGDRTISIDRFEAELERRSADGSTASTLEERRALLREMVRREAVVSRAVAAGYDRDPEFLAAVQRILAGRYIEDHLNPRLESISVTDAEVRARFERDRAAYSRPERVKGAIIFLEIGPRATPDDIAELARRAEALREAAVQLEDHHHLGRLALENSDDRATRYTGGVLPWMARGADTKWGSEVVDTLFAIDAIGGVGPVVRTDDGFYIVRLVDREAREQLPFEMYAAGIRRQILREKRNQAREEFYRAIEDDVDLSIDASALSSIPGLLPEGDEEEAGQPPALPGE